MADFSEEKIRKALYTLVKKREIMDQITGYIERITFQSPETGYTVAKLQQPRKTELTCLVGFMPSLQPGETIRCFGEWKRHLVHGHQFEVSEYKLEAPADLNGIEKYLGSGLIKGIGAAYASRIVKCFGIETLDIIDQNPERLREVPGLGKKRMLKIKECWQDQKSIREVMIFLQSNGVSPSYAQKIYKAYGNKSIERVKENPYTLARDIFGIGFKMADKIAKQMGIENDSPLRIDSGIEYVLSNLSNEGHVCHPIPSFLEESASILEIMPSLIQNRLEILKNNHRIILNELVHEGSLQLFIWLPSLFNAEVGIARELRRLIKEKSSLREVNKEKALEWVQNKLSIQLGETQKQAIANALTLKIEIITGGPGTGKSTITNAILNITEQLTDKILLAAPTGKAAKRMTEITKKKAYTLHSLLEYDFKTGGFKRNRMSPLDCDLLIVDEASMIDTILMNSLLKAIPNHARVIFVGDINQLPSVGPGNVLKDIIQAKCVPVIQLNEIFRQALGSRIVTNAHLINSGKLPDLSNPPDSDFYFVDAEDPDNAVQQILTLVTQRIPKKYRFDPITDIQVLAPMRKGALGTENLNQVLQDVLNPSKAPLFRAGKRLAAGDKVMQIRNNYDKKVFNGDVGRIQKIDQIEQTVFVDFEELSVEYDFSELDEIVLSYAVSVHKYQGSEAPCIVMPIHTSHFKLLHRNLLYTGVTRAKKLIVIVGSAKAIGIAARNDEVKKRYTGLREALLEIHNLCPI